ncbi:hypothetical protein MGN70_001710 [Eutypa lata]|nr:hypothetical protein MGN70_001710 [Eutypa lata]
MKRSSSAGRSPVQRLPVNHRRHKVAPEARKRVATAECEYPVTIEKISVPRTEFEELRKKCASLEQCFKDATRDGAYRREFVSPATSVTAGSSVGTATMQSTENTDDEASTGEGRILHDPDGTARYLGSTSGATFLDALKEFMRTVFPIAWPNFQGPEGTFLNSLGFVQTHDSRPLPQHDGVVPTYLPDQADMETMVAQLKYFIQDGNGEYASGGIFYWGDLDPTGLEENHLHTAMNPRTVRYLGLFNAAFAMTCHLETPTEVRSKGIQLGEPYFMRARFWLGNPLETTNYTPDDLPALAMMSMYLIEVNRRDTAYLYVSIGMHLAIMRGVHRGFGVDEHGKRAFWTLYVLDRWLSCLMGRPPTIQDEAIQLLPPSDFSGMPPAIGLRAHVELSKICGYIVCNTYRIAPWERGTISTSALVDNALTQLSGWLANLPPELQMGRDTRSNDRACCELHMTYNQLLILTVRPIFFMAVKKAVADRYTERTWNLENHAQLSRIRQCIEAARANLRLGRWIRDSTISHKLLTCNLHNIFNAATILLLNQLLFDSLGESQDLRDIWFAIECFEAEGRGENNYAKDCTRVLKDLDALVKRMRDQTFEDRSQVRNSQFATPQTQLTATTAYDVGFILNPEVPPNILPNQHNLPGTIYNELSNWIDHDDLQLYNDPLFL